MRTSTLSGCDCSGNLSRRELTGAGERPKVFPKSFVQFFTHLDGFFVRYPYLGSTGPRSYQISSLLHHRDRLHGYATETKCHGRYRTRRKISALPFYPCGIHISFTQHSIPPPPPLPKFYSPDDHVMLEDESGRIRLVGDHIRKARLVTGVIIGALGAETANGDFEVVDICYPGMAPQLLSGPEIAEQQDKMEVDSRCCDTSSDHRELTKSHPKVHRRMNGSLSFLALTSVLLPPPMHRFKC